MHSNTVNLKIGKNKVKELRIFQLFHFQIIKIILGYGSSFKIDRVFTTKELGFDQQNIFLLRFV